MSKVCIVGGGAAGMMAAVSAANHGHEVTLFEKNDKLGKKIYITGKGRCNLTNTCDTVDFFDHVMKNRKFLYSAVYGFDAFAVIDFFEQNHMPVKVERGERAFPVSDHASDVTKALQEAMRAGGVKVCLSCGIKELLVHDEQVIGVVTEQGGREMFDAVILATGGLSYPQTGSTGDGMRFAKALGHHILPCYPSLVAMDTADADTAALQGLSLRNIGMDLLVNGRKKDSAFGEMLFTHFGVSGPLILTASAKLADKMSGAKVTLSLDLKPALTEEKLDERILRDFEKYANRDLINALSDLLPAKMIPVVIRRAGIDERTKVHSVTKEQRAKLRFVIKGFTVQVKGLRGYNEAVITRGGVDVKEINASTMESRIIKHLYFAGEMIDVDALTGGFNLQIAWSTGHLAGELGGEA